MDEAQEVHVIDVDTCVVPMDFHTCITMRDWTQRPSDGRLARQMPVGRLIVSVREGVPACRSRVALDSCASSQPPAGITPRSTFTESTGYWSSGREQKTNHEDRGADDGRHASKPMRQSTPSKRVPAPAGLAPAERRIYHYARVVSNLHLVFSAVAARPSGPSGDCGKCDGATGRRFCYQSCAPLGQAQRGRFPSN